MNKTMRLMVAVQHKTRDRCRFFLIRISTFILFVTVSAPVLATSPNRESVGSNETQFLPPVIHYDITAAEVWRCSTTNIGVNEMNTLTTRGQQHQFEILKHGDNWVDLLMMSTQNPTDKLHLLDLTDCFIVTSMGNLLKTELQQNWRTLQHHILYSSWQDLPGGFSQFVQKHFMNSVHGLDIDGHQNVVKVHSHSTLKREAAGDIKTAAEKCKGLAGCDKQLEQSRDVGHNHDHLDKGWFAQYHNYSQVYAWFHQLAEDHPNTVSLNQSIGRTYYGRDILAVHFTDKQSVRDAGLKRPKIYFQCLLHAREWITGSVCMYLAKTLVSPESHPKLKELLSKVEFVMIPVTNPDGYFLTWYQYPKFRLWRKNVHSFGDGNCVGVDLNRNFDVNWNQEVESGSSEHCSELYRGLSAGSEMEVKAISSYFESLSPVIGAVDFHSYHQEVLYPPASNYEVPSQALEAIGRVAKLVASSASQVGVPYSSRKMIDVYSAAGTFADWMLMRSLSREQEDKCLIPLTIELRPTYDKEKGVYYGFLLPATEILPACQEMVAAVVKFAELAHEHAASCLSRP